MPKTAEQIAAELTVELESFLAQSAGTDLLKISQPERRKLLKSLHETNAAVSLIWSR